MKTIFNCILIMFLLSGCTSNQPGTKHDNFAGDVPKPVSRKISLAGSPEPDIIRFLKVKYVRPPSLSPDGKMIAYRTRLTSDFQIWVTRTDRLSAPLQITFGNSVTFIKWSPDNSGILYGADRDGDEKEGYYFISGDGLHETELLPPSDAYRHFGDFNRDGTLFTYSTTERNGTDFDIHVYNVANGTDRTVYPGKMGYYPVSFSPDGKYIIISEEIGEDANNLYLLNIADSTLTRINDERELAFYADIQWRADSRAFYLLTNQDREYTGVAIYSLDDQTFEYVLTHDSDIEQILLTKSGKLHWVSNEQGYSGHHIFDLSRQATIPVPDWPRGVISLQVSDDEKTVTAHISSPTIPGDVWSQTAGATGPIRITRSNNAGLDLSRMAVPEAHSFPARDGLIIHGLLYSPENGGPDAPVIVRVHGGPTGQARPTYDELSQYLIKKGFAIFDLNYRGSTGYGKSYARANNLRKRADELYDLEDAVQYLTGIGIGNPDNMAVMGESYGGYLTMAALTRLPDLFTCGVAIVGVSNWITALEGASPKVRASDRFEYGDINDPEERSFFRSISPITYIDQEKAPVMVMHGVNDPTDPVAESDRFVEKIRKNGGEVEYLRFPDAGHGVRRMGNRITAYVRIADFLEKHMQ